MMTGEALLSSGGIRRFLLGLLQEQFREPEDLSFLPSLVARLKRECDDREEEILRLNKRISLAFSSWISQSTEVGRILSGIECVPPCPSRDGIMSLCGKILHVELPYLAKEVGRIQSVRLYAETALCLEALVGDLEDAAFSMIKQVSRNKFENNISTLSKQTAPEDEIRWRLEKLRVAMKAMKDIEEVLDGVAFNRPWWINLLKAVDSRVEKALAILRPQCVTDHRILIASLGWPPPLSTTSAEKDKSMEMPNPLSLMQGQKKDKYCQSFLALCSLQHLQAKREARLSFPQGNKPAYDPSDSKEVQILQCGIWPIDELVKPIASRMEYHFSRWLDQPKFIFALVYKITQNFIDGIETILQPLIDKAMLLGCSAKESWVAAMVKMLSGYVDRQVFPVIVKNHLMRNASSEASSSLLHMVDLMITFDKRMRILSTSGTHIAASFTTIDRFAPSLSIMSIFYEHSDWFQMWAEMELEDAENKLTTQMKDESSWMIVFSKHAGCTNEKEESFLFSSREDYKAPLITDSVIRLAREMIDRGLLLPCSQMTNRFISSSANLFLSHFFSALIERIRDVEYMAAVVDDAQLLRVCSSMNAARYCKHVLHEWSEDVNLMEMSENNRQNSLYEDGEMFLVNLQTDCLEEIVTALLVRFNDLCWNYVQDSNQWEINQDDSGYIIRDENYLRISPNFIEAADMLRDRIQFLKLHLNTPDFLDLWRSIAGGLDHFIFASIPMSNARFSSLGVHQFRIDMKAIFLIFKPFCARPEAFFPCISNSLKLLEADEKDSDQMLKLLSQGHAISEDCLRLRGIFNVSPDQAEKILRNRTRRG